MFVHELPEALVLEQGNEWLAGRCYFSLVSMALLYWKVPALEAPKERAAV